MSQKITGRLRKNIKFTLAALVALSFAVSGTHQTAFAAEKPAVAASPQTITANSKFETAPATLISDAELNRLISALENLPEDLKNADPKTTPDYEKRIREALKDLKITIKICPESGAITPQGS